MWIVLSVLAAVALGTSDFCAARAGRWQPSVTTTRTAVAASLVPTALYVAVDGSTWRARDLWIGAAAGLAMVSALVLLYQGYKIARIGVVAPMSSVLAAAVPVVWSLARGQSLSATEAAGVGVGLVAILLTSYQRSGTGSVTSAIVLGVVSGVGFGTAFTLMGEVGDGAGLAPVISQRAAGLGLLTVVALTRVGGPAPYLAASGPGRWYSVATGALAAVGIGSLQLALLEVDASGSGVVAVITSQFASIAVLTSVVFNRERMAWWQAVGVVASAGGVALMAAG